MALQTKTSVRSVPDVKTSPQREGLIYTVLISSVGRTRLCTPLKSSLTKGGDE